MKCTVTINQSLIQTHTIITTTNVVLLHFIVDAVCKKKSERICDTVFSFSSFMLW